jgi:hypothetical protein
MVDQLGMGRQYDAKHWTFFAVEENWTYHLRSMLKIHNFAAVDNFCTLIYIAYATSRGWILIPFSGIKL